MNNRERQLWAVFQVEALSSFHIKLKSEVNWDKPMNPPV